MHELEAGERVRVGNNDTAALDRGNNRLVNLGSQLAVGPKTELLVVEVLVDDAGHAVLAVVTVLLRAVVPDGRLCLLDDNLEDIVGLALLDGKVEARVDRRPIGKGLAGLAERGLRDCVVARQEVPLYNVALFSNDVVRLEAQASEAGDNSVRYTSELNDGRGVGGVSRGRDGCDGSNQSHGDRERRDGHFDDFLRTQKINEITEGNKENRLGKTLGNNCYAVC